MKKCFVLLFFFAYVTKLTCQSHTFFWTRPQFMMGSPEYLTLARTGMHDNDTDWFFGVTLFGGRTTNSEKISAYFMPFGCPSILIDGTIAPNSFALSPQHFNIFSVKYSAFTANLFQFPNITDAFKSSVSFNPHQSTLGLGLLVRKYFYCNDITWYLSLSAPLQWVQNSMGLHECIGQPGQFYDIQPLPLPSNLDVQFRSMTQALSQKNWCYGKIDHCNHSKVRLTFIQAHIGIPLLYNDCFFEPFLGVTISTGNQPNNYIVFEPIVGTGGHSGIFWGVSSEIGLLHLCNETSNLSFATDIVLNYLFAKTHIRSFDVCNRPWSRYQELYSSREQAEQALNLSLNGTFPPVGQTNTQRLQGFFLASPGINIFTRCAKVHPGFMLTMNSALRYSAKHCNHIYSLELGYNFFAKQAERIHCIAPIRDEIALKDHVGSGITNPIRDITSNSLKNEAALFNLLLTSASVAGIRQAYDQAIITTADLDPDSAAHPCIISHTLYINETISWYEKGWNLNGGLSYEFSDRRSPALNRWLLWFGFSYDC